MLWQNIIVFVIVGCAFGWIIKAYLLPQAITDRFIAQRRQAGYRQNHDSSVAIMCIQDRQQQPQGGCSDCIERCPTER